MKPDILTAKQQKQLAHETTIVIHRNLDNSVCGTTGRGLTCPKVWLPVGTHSSLGQIGSEIHVSYTMGITGKDAGTWGWLCCSSLTPRRGSTLINLNTSYSFLYQIFGNYQRKAEWNWFPITNQYGIVAFLRIRLSALGPAMTNDIVSVLPRVLPM